MENVYKRTKNKKLSFAQEVFRARWIYLGLLPTFLLLAFFNLYPAFEAVRKSFFYWKMSNLKGVRFIGLDNYIRLFHDGDFWYSFLNLAIFVVWNFFTTFIVLMPVTYLVYKLGESSSGKWIQRLYVIPMMVPSMVLILFWRLFYDYYYGVLNVILNSIGLGGLTHVWLGEKATAMPSLLFMSFPWISGFGFLILLSAFQGIDSSLHESAEIDGAKALQQFFKIDIPLIIPQAKLLIIINMIFVIQQYGTQLVMTQGGPNGATTVPGLVMYDTAFTIGDLGYGSTIGVALFIIILIVTVINNKLIKNKE